MYSYFNQLIETFDGSREGSAEPQDGPTVPKSASVGESLSELKQRRGSLQVLNVDLPEEEENVATKRKSDHAKQLRDQSNMTSTIFQSPFIVRGLVGILFPFSRILQGS